MDPIFGIGAVIGGLLLIIWWMDKSDRGPDPAEKRAGALGQLQIMAKEGFEDDGEGSPIAYDAILSTPEYWHSLAREIDDSVLTDHVREATSAASPDDREQARANVAERAHWLAEHPDST